MAAPARLHDIRLGGARRHAGRLSGERGGEVADRDRELVVELAGLGRRERPERG